MAITLTTPYAFPNGTRIVVKDVRPNDEASTLSLTIELRSPPATNFVAASAVLTIRNGLSDRVSRNAAPPAGTRYEAALVYEPNAITTATGFTDAMAAIRAAANTPAARAAALETEGLAKGWIHSSLTGT